MNIQQVTDVLNEQAFRANEGSILNTPAGGLVFTSPTHAVYLPHKRARHWSGLEFVRVGGVWVFKAQTAGKWLKGFSGLRAILRAQALFRKPVSRPANWRRWS